MWEFIFERNYLWGNGNFKNAMIISLLIVAILGIVITTIFFFKKTTNPLSIRILGVFYFILSLYALQIFINDGGYLKYFSWYFLWPLVLYNLIFIPIYYYFKVVIDDELRFKPPELILLIPFLLGIIDLFYIYLQPSIVYDAIISEAINFPEKRLGTQYGLLSLQDHILIRHFWQVGVLCAIAPKLKRFIQKDEHNNLKTILDKWLVILWSVLMIMAILAVFYIFERIFEIETFYSFSILGENNDVISFLFYIVLFFIGIIPIYFPSIMNGYPRRKSEQVNPIALDETENEILKYGLDEKVIYKKLEKLEEGKLYVDKNFTLTECARELEMPPHHISHFLKNQYQMTFVAYKNNLRMEYAKRLIANRYLEDNTIEALGHKCGFTSRTSFSTTFKKVVKVSPSQYADSLS